MTFTRQIWKYHSLLLIPAILSFIVAGYMYGLYLYLDESIVVSLLKYSFGFGSISAAEKMVFILLGMSCIVLLMGIVLMRVTRKAVRGKNDVVMKMPIEHGICVFILDLFIFYFLTTAGMSLQKHDFVGFMSLIAVGIVSVGAMLFIHLTESNNENVNQGSFQSRD